jgi:hypothetical protein
MGRSRTNLTTKQVYLAPRAEAAAAAAACASSAANATVTDATANVLQQLQLQEQQQSSQPTTASDRQHLEACYQQSLGPSSSTQDASTSSTTTKRYLCYFLHRLLDFRVPELTALADMYGVPDVRCEAPAGEHGSVCPFWYVHLPNEQVAAQIVARAVLIRVSYCCRISSVVFLSSRQQCPTLASCDVWCMLFRTLVLLVVCCCQDLLCLLCDCNNCDVVIMLEACVGLGSRCMSPSAARSCIKGSHRHKCMSTCVCRCLCRHYMI